MTHRNARRGSRERDAHAIRSSSRPEPVPAVGRERHVWSHIAEDDGEVHAVACRLPRAKRHHCDSGRRPSGRPGEKRESGAVRDQRHPVGRRGRLERRGVGDAQIRGEAVVEKRAVRIGVREECDLHESGRVDGEGLSVPAAEREDVRFRLAVQTPEDVDESGAVLREVGRAVGCYRGGDNAAGCLLEARLQRAGHDLANRSTSGATPCAFGKYSWIAPFEAAARSPRRSRGTTTLGADRLRGGDRVSSGGNQQRPRDDRRRDDRVLRPRGDRRPGGRARRKARTAIAARRRIIRQRFRNRAHTHLSLACEGGRLPEDRTARAVRAGDHASRRRRRPRHRVRTSPALRQRFIIPSPARIHNSADTCEQAALCAATSVIG